VIDVKANHNTVYGGAGLGVGRKGRRAGKHARFVALLGGWQALSVVALAGCRRCGWGGCPLGCPLPPPLTVGPTVRKWDWFGANGRGSVGSAKNRIGRRELIYQFHHRRRNLERLVMVYLFQGYRP
jgi:hypothetical protein